MKPSEPLLLPNVTLRCGMYLTGKVDISQHVAIPGFPQSDHTVLILVNIVNKIDSLKEESFFEFLSLWRATFGYIQLT